MDFPILHPGQAHLGGDYDGFVAKFDHSGANLIYATYIGGNLYDHSVGLQVHSDGSTYVAGVTFSSDFPVKNAIQAKLKGISDAFAGRLDPSGSQLVFSTYLGGSGSDQASDIALDRAGNAYLSGNTNSPDFPVTANAYQRCARSIPPEHILPAWRKWQWREGHRAGYELDSAHGGL